MTDDQLGDELRALGRSVVVSAVPEDLREQVLDRVRDLPVKRSLRQRWRMFLTILLLLLAGAAVTPPVRATVAEWLHIGGVKAQPVGSGPAAAPSPPVVTGRMSLAEAARTAGFTPAVPSELGQPEGVEASAGLVAMSWPGVVRLEQFRAELHPVYLKKYYSQLEPVPDINGYWFSTPHNLLLVDSAGQEQEIRVAGPTLVWVRAGVTYRLEGVGKDRAVELARGTG